MIDQGTVKFFPRVAKKDLIIDAAWNGSANQIDLVLTGSQNGVGILNDIDASFIIFKVEKSPGSTFNACLGPGVSSLPSSNVQVNSGQMNVKFL